MHVRYYENVELEGLPPSYSLTSKYHTVERKRAMAKYHQQSLHWFRKGLRLHDNPSLLAAVRDSQEFRAVFILDPMFVKSGTVGINRWRFLLQSLQDLDDGLKGLGSRLYVLRGKPTEVFPDIFKKWKISHLTFELDTEPYATQRDEAVEAIAEKHGVQITKKSSHTLYDIQSITRANGGKTPMTYQSLLSIVSKMAAPRKPDPALSKEDLQDCKLPVTSDHDSQYGVPSLEELGLDPKDAGPVLFPGGETEAVRRMEEHLERQEWVCRFEKPKTEPNTLSPSTTVLSPYLKFGCLSPRLFYHKIQDVYTRKKNHSKPPVSLHGQLLWREFFYTVAATTPNFHKMEGNPVCLQVPWDTNQEYLQAWKEARTGYPFIDAIMTQLKQEGWIHHLARHAVACFLTRGDLWISWEEGQKVFEEWLLDADYSLNAGNWMWLSASAFFHQYFRVYSPIVFGKKTDKNGDYIRKYLPVLKKMPSQYIYEPWTAPRTVQEKAGCIVGTDYPRPIVEHSVVMKRNIERMKKARAEKYGNNNGPQKAISSPKTSSGGTKRKSKSKDDAGSSNKRTKKMTDFF
ncbi:cryptochrome-2-like [Patiria miniata]|uniref:Photolyase/cryptochrome alpha/beta domain-containing protein n=1 Tax=Patiria miniata TaxID=46514 RepID=A0A914AJJ8_PATMI|nr:cryptochrome-2-like [Patiria miniata]